MLNYFKTYNNPFNTIEEKDSIGLRLNDSEHIDDNFSIELIIAIFQSLKDRYMKNDQLYITLNSCLRGPIMSWIDYQIEYIEIFES
jgi:hypothetical protein